MTDAARPPLSDRPAFWSSGFRPFFLAAGAYAAAGMLAWAAQIAGWTGERVYVPGSPWHAHEMIFGYAFAVLAGFLLTAVRNWTNRPTLEGPALALAVGCWLAARALVPTPWRDAALWADAGFALVLAYGIGAPLARAGNRRNYFFVALVLLLGTANAAFYMTAGAAGPALPARTLQAGLDILLFVMVVMGGRVIPMFTANAVPGVQPERVPFLERFALGSVAALLAADLVNAPPLLDAVVTGAAALAHAVRLALWRPWRTLRRPILWILHAGYAWIVIHLILRALADARFLAPGPAIHALTVGAIGTLTLGMMTRVARGHTGRPLAAGGAELAAYVLIQMAALTRVVLPLAVPGWQVSAFIVSGAMWSAAFALFTAKFAPILVRPRSDGRPG